MNNTRGLLAFFRSNAFVFNCSLQKVHFLWTILYNVKSMKFSCNFTRKRYMKRTYAFIDFAYL